MKTASRKAGEARESSSEQSRMEEIRRAYKELVPHLIANQQCEVWFEKLFNSDAFDGIAASIRGSSIWPSQIAELEAAGWFASIIIATDYKQAQLKIYHRKVHAAPSSGEGSAAALASSS